MTEDRICSAYIFTSGRFRLTCGTENGTWSLDVNGIPVITDARAEADLSGTVISSAGFASHTASQDGDTVRFIHRDHPEFSGIMTQVFSFEENLHTEVILSGSPVRTNRISPIESEKVQIGSRENSVFMRIPFDNDKWVEPGLISFGRLSEKTVSCEAAAVFDTGTNHGIVIGSVEHEVWKTGVIAENCCEDGIKLSVFGGLAEECTRDNSPHGYITGEEVRSPLIFIGYFDDWRIGLRKYAEANTAVCPRKESVADVPFGYNSWGVLQDKVKYSDMTAVSDYIKKYLQDIWTADGAPVYVNIDSFWDFLVHNDPDIDLPLEEALKSFVAHCRERGQKAGIYFTPFTAWHGDEKGLKSSRMEGSDWTYYDAAVKKSDGSGLYGKLDGGYALDPTHPGTIARMEQKLGWFVKLGFEYVKLDFMTHGAVEGVHYDPKITTGMQAYNAGMARIDEICRGKMFVNLSIAPLFPYRYADGRRISCDAFSSLDNTKHVLSYLTACFWEDEIYPYPDPDHLVVWGRNGDVSEGEARCRVTAGAICGTSFLIGDDLTDLPDNKAKHERILKLFGNADIVSTAKLGRMFMPYTAQADRRCADTFILETSEAVYLAVFNFDKTERTISLDLSDKISRKAHQTAHELWSGCRIPLDDGVLNHIIPGEDAAVFRIDL